MIGELIDHYRVLELVGRGAMGVVYKALDENLDRTVAIKVMSAEARNDPDFVERFRLEARVQAALNHPNVALLFDYFVHDGVPVAVMEFIDGESLEQLIRRRGAIPAHEVVPIFKQALRGVAAAHRAGIVHRDLKPGNLMATRDDIVKVMDFGIAKRKGVTGATKVSTSIGSPMYMAPEQILGRPVDSRTDIYALGITLYELLAGQRPFSSRAKAEYLVLDAHVNELPEPPTVYRYGIPQPVVDAVMRSLAKDPNARFQSAEEFSSALPDLPAPTAASTTPATGTALRAARRPTGTVPLARVGPTGTVAIPPAQNAAPAAAPGRTGTLVIERPQPPQPGGTVVFDYSPPRNAGSGTARTSSGPGQHTPTQRIDPPGSVTFDYSASTALLQDVYPDRTASAAVNSPAATPDHAATAPQRVVQRAWVSRAAIAATLVVALVAGWLFMRQAPRPQPPLASSNPRTAPPQESTPTEAPVSAEPALARPPVADLQEVPAPVPSPEPAAVTTPPATRPAATPAPHALSGTWSGAYVNATGKQLLRVVSLNISRVYPDGGVEGSLQYQAASGDGECKLNPRGSNWSAAAHRLQLSPESCSPRYPRELGVPLDFAGVNPRANMLKDGRIEAPTGEVIKVRLKRMSGV